MITLSKNDLQEFQKRTVKMRKNTLLPILSYLRLDWRFDKHWLTKSNAQTVCNSPIGGTSDSDYKTILLDERILFAILPTIKGEHLQVELKDASIVLTDGGTMLIEFQREDPTNFPAVPEVTNATDHLTLNHEHINAIKIASNYTIESSTSGNFQFVHIGGKGIRAFSTTFFYVNAGFDDLPKLQLGSEEADVVGEANVGAKLSNGDRHIFLQDGTFLYIFTKQEASSPELEAVLSKLKLPGKNFEIGKNDLLDFCNLANAVSETPIADCLLEPNGGMFAKLRMLDANYARSASKEVIATGDFDAFAFNSRLISQPLSVVPYEQLKAKTNQNCLIISNEGQTEYFAFIGMQKS